MRIKNSILGFLLLTATLFADPTITCNTTIELNLNGYVCCQFEQLWPGSAVTIEMGETTYIQVRQRSRSDSTIAEGYGIVHIPFLQPGDYRFGFEGHGIDTVRIICADYQVPVEVENFWFDGIYLRWTVNETGYPIYEIYREHLLLARIFGTGQRDYHYRDRQPSIGEHEYFLACVEQSRRREVLDSVTVSYGQNMQAAEPSMEYLAGQVRLVLPQSAQVEIAVFNILGQQVAVLADGYFQSGIHQFQFDGSPHPTGIYLVRGRFGDGATVTKKMPLVK